MRNHSSIIRPGIRGPGVLGLIFGLLAWLAPLRGQRAVRDYADMSLEDLMDVPVVSASRRPQAAIDTSRAVSVITRQELVLRNYRTVPEALMELAGVMVQETNYGGGSPIIRGMVGNRILILVDGVRMNNAIYRLGPNQYLNTIDIHQVERIEVVRGPSSVLYGSDALGGLINVITRTGPDTATGPQVRAATRFSTADGGVIGRLEAGGRHGRLAYLGGATGKRFGNLSAGGGLGRQPFTGYGEYDGDLRIDYQATPSTALQFGVAHVNQMDVPRTDALAAGTDLEYHWDPQQRTRLYGRMAATRPFRGVESLLLGASYHSQRESLRRINAARPDSRMHTQDEVGSAGLTLQFASPLGERHLLTYGSEGYVDLLHSSAQAEDRTSGRRIPAKSTYADGAKFWSAAAFVQDEMRLSRRLTLTPGVRFNFFDLEANVRDASAGEVKIDSHPTAWTASVYANYELLPKVSLFAGFAQGFRAPNADDLTVFGPASSGFEVPNHQLAPERSNTGEVGVKIQNKRLSASVSFYDSFYRDLVERRPGLFEGRDFLDVNGNGIRDTGERSIYTRQNIGRAHVRGWTAEGQWRLERPWTLYANVDWTYGHDHFSGQPLTRIPPLKSVAGARWNPRRTVWLESYVLAAGPQRRLSASDRADRRIRPGGTPGFALLNFRGGVEVPGLGVLTLGLENATNKAYRWHGSGLDGPGTNLVFGLARSF